VIFFAGEGAAAHVLTPDGFAHRLQTGRTADGGKRHACASDAVWPMGDSAVVYGRAEREAMVGVWDARPEKRLHIMDSMY
jgi:hypothetical protein